MKLTKDLGKITSLDELLNQMPWKKKKHVNHIYQKYAKNNKTNELKEEVNKQLKMMLDCRYTFATN